MSPYPADSVDVCLIAWMLSLTPAERPDVLQEFVEFIEQAWMLDGQQIPAGSSDVEEMTG